MKKVLLLLGATISLLGLAAVGPPGGLTDAVPEVDDGNNQATGTVEIKDNRIINSQFG